MYTTQKIVLRALVALTVVFAVLVINGVLVGIDRTQVQVVAVAEDLGCTVIEQSYHHPENFYIDCGDDNIRIINVEK